MKQDILRNERKKKLSQKQNKKKDLSIPLAIILRLRVRLSLCRDELHYGTALGDKLWPRLLRNSVMANTVNGR